MSLEANGSTGASLTRFERFNSILPADAALLHATPRRAWVVAMMRINPNQPSLDLSSEAMGSTDILCP